MLYNLIVINPSERTIAREMLEGADVFEVARAKIGCSLLEPVYLDDLECANGAWTMLVNEEGFLVDNDVFSVKGAGQPFAGIAVIALEAESTIEDSCDLDIGLIEEMVEWREKSGPEEMRELMTAEILAFLAEGTLK